MCSKSTVKTLDEILPWWEELMSVIKVYVGLCGVKSYSRLLKSSFNVITILTKSCNACVEKHKLIHYIILKLRHSKIEAQNSYDFHWFTFLWKTDEWFWAIIEFYCYLFRVYWAIWIFHRFSATKKDRNSIKRKWNIFELKSLLNWIELVENVK